jgi:hypothetical protein
MRPLIARVSGRRAEGEEGRIVGRIVSIHPRQGVQVGELYGGVVRAEIEDRLGALRMVYADGASPEAARLYEYAGGTVHVVVYVVGGRDGRWNVQNVQPTDAKFWDFGYRSLNDAAERHEILGLKKGDTEVWYIRDSKWRNTMMFAGYVGDGEPPNLEGWSVAALPVSHTLLGKVATEDEEAIWMALQANQWSPQGEARPLIQKLGLHHTSMMMGDIIVLPDGTARLAVSVGFVTVGRIRK